MDYRQTISELTTEEKIALVSGTRFTYTNGIGRLHIPSLCMSDGPLGLRKQKDQQDSGDSMFQSEPATAFPAPAAVACSWNPENAEKTGKAIAGECRYYGVHVLLGPGVNLQRNPLCGRNFEYYSEDPLLAGSMGASMVRGLQENGTAACLKHFALNNAENYRFMGNSVCSRRTMRELYLKTFEYIIRKCPPEAVMCAYNQINGTFCSENRWLLTEVLREEWGFDGLVMTDWGAAKDRAAGLRAGLDLEMPGDTAKCREDIKKGLKNGTLPMKSLDQAAYNVLKLANRRAGGIPSSEADFKSHHELAGEIACDCAVLLKNNGALPLTGDETLLAAGEMFVNMRYQGAGSSMIQPAYLTSPEEAFRKAGISFQYAPGYKTYDSAEEAVHLAEQCDTVLIFAGLTDYAECEGGDREHMRLPEEQICLIKALCDAVQEHGSSGTKESGTDTHGADGLVINAAQGNRSGIDRKIILVLFGGSPVELPFADRVDAILNMSLPGQNGGAALVKLLYGQVSPSGRLAQTWPVCYEDVPGSAEFSKEEREIYLEGIFMGYRHYLTRKVPVRYPFGFGLSYTRFSYSRMTVQNTGRSLLVSCDVTNTGDRKGAEVVQLYVSMKESSVPMPEKELRGFCKLYLNPGECRRAELEVSLDDLRYYHPEQGRFVLSGGLYELQFCSDCTKVLLSETIRMEGEEIPWKEEVLDIPSARPKRPITTESRFTDLQQTLPGRILFRAVLSMADHQARKAEHLPEGPQKENQKKAAMFLRRVLESGSLRSMSMSAGDKFPFRYAQALAELANWHIWKGIKTFLSTDSDSIGGVEL